jgi:hypothetical protein
MRRLWAAGPAARGFVDRLKRESAGRFKREAIVSGGRSP